MGEKKDFEALEQQAILQMEQIDELKKDLNEEKSKRYNAELNEYKYKTAFKALVKELRGNE